MKKRVISIVSVILMLVMAFSTTAYAESYTVRTLPYGYQTEPQQEQELSSDLKEEILQTLLKTEYKGCDEEDIVIRCYGTLDNGALLINHYNNTYEYYTFFASILDESVSIKYENVTLVDITSTEKDRVYLYIDGEFYAFKDAYESNLIDIKNVWEIEHSLDNFIFFLGVWCDDDSDNHTDIIGDVDGNGEINVIDATFLQKKLADNYVFNENEISCADFNGDGELNIIDVTFIQKTATGIFA